MVEINEKTEQASWNLSQAMINELANLLSAASYHFVRGRYGQSLIHLEAVRMRLAATITNDERQEFRDLEKTLHTLLNQETSIHPFEQESIFKWNTESLPKIHELLDIYNEKLMLCLKKYGLLIPPKEDKTRMMA